MKFLKSYLFLVVAMFSYANLSNALSMKDYPKLASLAETKLFDLSVNPTAPKVGEKFTISIRPNTTFQAPEELRLLVKARLNNQAINLQSITDGLWWFQNSTNYADGSYQLDADFILENKDQTDSIRDDITQVQKDIKDIQAQIDLEQDDAQRELLQGQLLAKQQLEQQYVNSLADWQLLVKTESFQFQIIPLPVFTNVAAAGSSACGLKDGAVYCWGNNQFGQLGLGDTTMRSIATVIPSLSSNVTSIVGKSLTMCAIKNGGAYCWGQNSGGQLGIGNSNAFEASPVAVVGLSSGVSKISAGFIHTCAIQNGQVYCWGISSHGRLGIGYPSSSMYTTPQSVSLPEDAVDISVADRLSCAVTVSGKIYCWGYNDSGQIGNGTGGGEYYTPQLVSGIASGATAVAASEQFTCAIVNGGAKCWGANYIGQLGIGYDSGSLTTPQDVVGLSSGVTAISNNTSSTTCVIQNGIVKCWGSGANGSLGNGATSNANTAVNVVGFSGPVSAISFGSFFGCGIEQGRIKCWGADQGGNLGNGNSGDQLTAQPITEPSPSIRRK